MKPGFAAIIAWLGLVLPGAAQAQDANPDPPDWSKVDFSTLEDAALTAIFQNETREWLSRPCEVGEPAAAELVRRQPGKPALQRPLLLTRALCFDSREKFEEALAAFRSLEKVSPDADMIGLALHLERRANDAQATLQRLRSMRAEQISRLEPEAVWPSLRMISKNGREDELGDVIYGWVKGGRFAALPEELREGFAMRALKAANRAKRPEIAQEILVHIRTTGSYISLLSDRAYELVWPSVEAAAGPNLRNVSAAYVERELARFRENPEDRKRYHNAVRALHYAGRFEEAVTLSQQEQPAGPSIDEIEEEDAWALNLVAHSHDSLGQVDKADEIFERLARIDAGNHPWVVNFVINRASRLVGLARWEEGLEATALARQVAERNGSTYAKLLIARDRACALGKLGRNVEVAAELQYLEQEWKDAPAIAAQGLACADRKDRAVELLLEGLRDESLRPALLDEFPGPEFDLFYTASVLPTVHGLMIEYPSLRTEVERYIRQIPDAFIPEASLRRSN